MTAYGEGLRPAPPYGGDVDEKGRPLSPLCPNTDPPAWLYWGYHCTTDKEMRRNFAITCADYYRLLEAQGGVCGACGKPQHNRQLAVDHDHDNHEIRGLLCTYCNRALARGIGRYLADPPARKVGPFFIPEDRIEVMKKRNRQRSTIRKRQAKKKADEAKRTNGGPVSNLERIKQLAGG